MSEALYNREILRLAAEGGAAVRLAEAGASSGASSDASSGGSAVRVSPVCGSRVTADVRLDAAGRVVAHGQEVRACALGQAAATLVARAIIGKDRAALVAARAGLADWLAGGEAEPDWPGMTVFAPARPHRARHASILLGFDAAIGAVDAALASAKASSGVAA